MNVPTESSELAMPPAAVKPDKPLFRLRRYFSITSFFGVVVVVAALLFFNRQFAMHALMEHETRANVAVTQLFANNVWPRYARFIESARSIPRERLSTRPEIEQLRTEVSRQMRGLSIVKVKIYDLDGLTVFSTDPKQIGEDKRDNSGFRSARAGATASEITFRRSFDAFEQVIVDRNLISSYVPIRPMDGAAVEGVFEVYADVSDLVKRLERTQWQIAAVVLGSLTLLYGFLFLIVQRADSIIRARSEEERSRSRERLRHQSFHDALTGLPNRAMFVARLEEVIKYARRQGGRFAVLFLDIDHFKDINDTLGHFAGDRLLQLVGARLRDNLSEVDAVARLGGDEFALLLTQAGTIEQAARMADKVRECVSNFDYEIDGRKLRLALSVGISMFPDDGGDAMTLIKNADAAMYYAKEMGRDNCQFYTEQMNARAFAMLAMEHNLRRALDRDEFELYYQPQIELASGRLVGLEALIRWRHPELGLVSPAQFVSVAEERGLIVAIGDWVLCEACRQNKAWQDAGLPAIPVSVNVSALQLRQPDFLDRVTAAVHDSGLAAQYLELEITESVIMHGVGSATTAVHMLQALKAMGLKLSIDDFGTGYSSLSYLNQFPIDKLKIDKSFVRGLPFNSDNLAIATAVISMAKALMLRVIAEGVESREQYDFLRTRQCDEVQGNLLSAPLTAFECFQFMQQSQDSDAEVLRGRRA